MATNRFHTQRLPVYTSQFVEDQTPWGLLLAGQDQKYARESAGIEGAAKAESAFTSLLGGRRSNEILLPQVEEDYLGQIKALREKYDGHGSLPFMRELTAMQGKFQSDPRVKTILRDQAEQQQRVEQINHPNYRPEADPDIDPETGRDRQFQTAEDYQPYSAPVFIGDFQEEMRKRFAHLEPDITTGQAQSRVIEDEQGNPLVNVLEQYSYSGLGPKSKKIMDARDSYADELVEGKTDHARYLHQVAKLMGEEFTKEDALEIIKAEENQYYQTTSRYGSPQVLSSTSVEEEDDIPPTFRFTRPFEKQIKPNSPGLTTGGNVSKLTTIGQDILNKGIQKSPERLDYYNSMKDNPAAIIAADKELLENPLNTKDIINQSMAEDPYGTMAAWEEYWDSVDDTWMTTAEKAAQARVKKRMNKYIENAKERFKIEEPSFSNEVDLNRALNSLVETSALNDPRYEYKAEPFTDAHNLSPKQAHQLYKIKDRHFKDEMAKAWQGKLDVFSGELQKEFSQIFGGVNLGSDATIDTANGLTPQMAGATVIDPDKPNEFMELEDKLKEHDEGVVLRVNGPIVDQTSQYSVGMFSISVGDKEYIIRGPEEFAEPTRFLYNISTHQVPKAQGEGDLFYFTGDKGKTGFPTVIDRFNMDIAGGVTGSHTPMNVALDQSLLPSSDGESFGTPVYVLRSYKGNPELDEAFMNPYDEENNPKGYHLDILYGSNGYYANPVNPPDNYITEYWATVAHYRELVRKNFITNAVAIEKIQMLYPDVNRPQSLDPEE